MNYRSVDAFVIEYRRNIERGGAFIRTPKPLPVGRECLFEVRIPGVDESLVFPGVVTWSSATLATLSAGQEDGMGIEYDSRRGVKVNDSLRTTNPRVYAAGDVCMAWKFTHAADAAARIVIQNTLFRGRAKLSALNMPWCTYTDPEVAHVGLYEADAKERGIETDTFKVDMSDIDRARTDGETEGFVKVLVRKGTDRILGATIVSTHAGEMISEVSVAMAAKAGLKTLSGVIHPYPTQAEAIKRVADAYNRTRLTPRVAAAMKWWLNSSA